MVKYHNHPGFVRRLMSVLVVLLLVAGAGTLWATGEQEEGAGGEMAELLFTYWGSPIEREAVENMLDAFNAEFTDIQVRGEHVPDAYEERMSTMLAGGNPPDVAYMAEGLAMQWFEEGVLLDLTDYFENDPKAANRLETTYYRTEEGRTLGTNTAAETMVLYYRKDLFDAAGLPYPPSRAEEAWTWDEFVEVAQRLTVDTNGNDATSSAFNPDNVDTYGIVFPQWWGGYTPLIYSNNGRVVNEEGTELLLNQPEAIEVLEAMQDLIYVHNAAPTPAEAASMPSANVMMQAGRVAMEIGGHWSVLDYSQLDMDWSVGVLPMFERPVTMILGAPTVIFEATEYPEQAFTFYKWHNDPEYVDLFRKGLWMPLNIEYYTDPGTTAEWLDSEPGVYPEESRDVFVDYTLDNTPVQPSVYWLRNWGQINNEVITPAMQLIWTNEATPQEAMDQAVQDARSLLQGRW